MFEPLFWMAVKCVCMGAIFLFRTSTSFSCCVCFFPLLPEFIQYKWNIHMKVVCGCVLRNVVYAAPCRPSHFWNAFSRMSYYETSTFSAKFNTDSDGMTIALNWETENAKRKRGTHTHSPNIYQPRGINRNGENTQSEKNWKIVARR